MHLLVVTVTECIYRALELGEQEMTDNDESERTADPPSAPTPSMAPASAAASDMELDAELVPPSVPVPPLVAVPASVPVREPSSTSTSAIVSNPLMAPPCAKLIPISRYSKFEFLLVLYLPHQGVVFLSCYFVLQVRPVRPRLPDIVCWTNDIKIFNQSSLFPIMFSFCQTEAPCEYDTTGPKLVSLRIHYFNVILLKNMKKIQLKISTF